MEVAPQEDLDTEQDQEVTVEVFPDTVTEIIYLSDYQIINDCSDSPNLDSEDTCDTEYEIGSVDTTKFPISDFVLDESGTIVLLASDGSEQEQSINEVIIKELYNCSECKFETDSLKKLESHQVEHADNHICAECTESFYSYALLMKHKRDEHTVFMCLVCKMDCVGSKFHRTHMRQHELHCEYQCSTCKTGFKSDEELMKHMKTHGALLLYACNICDEAFSKMPELSTHLKTAHPK